MAFPESFLTEVAERNDIADVVGSYVRFTKKSGSNLFGLCPFHSEKTPSFSVSPDRQIYHCFGCGKGGGVINFIMEIEGLSFPEAVEFLAKRANLPMPEEGNDRESKKRARMLALNVDAARYFRSQLGTPGGIAAREYMARRGISNTTSTNFGLGFAPDSWDGLRNAMHEKGYNDFEMLDAGLVKRGKNGGFYDMFRNRLMFPVIDVKGAVIGFSGRILGDGEPKYMNSPETLVYNKSRNLFALNLAKKSKCGYIILSEGNIDVASLHQAGFDSAVASLGTSLTEEQARLISRYTNEVVIAYDNDGAGQKAAQRAITILEKLDLKVRVLSMTGAKDPDEFIKLKGPDAFRNLLEGSENHVDYRLGRIIGKYDLSVSDQKVDFLKEASEFIAGLPDAIKRGVYAGKVAELAGVKQDVVADEIERRRKKRMGAAQKALNKAENRPELVQGPKDRELRYENTASAFAEEGLIRLLFLDQSLAAGQTLPPPEDFSSPALARIYAAILDKIRQGTTVSMAVLGDALLPQEASLLASLLQKPEVLSNGARAMADYIEKIKKEKELAKRGTDLLAMRDKLRETKGYGG